MLSLPIKAVFEEPTDLCTAILSRDGETVAQVLADADGEFPQVDLEPGEYMVRVLQNDEPGAFDHEEKGRCSGRMTIRLDPPWVDRLELAIEDLTRRVSALESLARMEAAQEALERRPETVVPEPEPVPEMPPEAIADLFQADRPFADQAKALWDRYNELTQKIMLKVATDVEREKHTKLQGELDWIKRHAFEGI